MSLEQDMKPSTEMESSFTAISTDSTPAEEVATKSPSFTTSTPFASPSDTSEGLSTKSPSSFATSTSLEELPTKLPSFTAISIPSEEELPTKLPYSFTTVSTPSEQLSTKLPPTTSSSFAPQPPSDMSSSSSLPSSPSPPLSPPFAPSLSSLPSLFLVRLLRTLSFCDLRALRCVNSLLKCLVDDLVTFRVPLNNTSLRWVKGCGPPISSLQVGLLTNPDFKSWSFDKNGFPEVEELIANNSSVEEDNLGKLFEIFPNIEKLTLKNLSVKELSSFLELRLERAYAPFRVKLPSEELPSLVHPKWSLLTSLEILINKIPEGISDVFSLLSLRHYSTLRTLTLDIRLQGYFKGNYEELHLIYVGWVHFIARHGGTLRTLSLRHDLGLDLEPENVPLNPQDNVDLEDPLSERSLSLQSALEGMSLEEINLTPHLHESADNRAWSWNWKILSSLKTVSRMTLDFTENPASRDPWLIHPIIHALQSTLTSFVYTGNSDKSLQASMTFDLAPFQGCKALTNLEICRGWSRRNIEWGPTILFENVSALPGTLKGLKLCTENGTFRDADALWVSRELVDLSQLTLPTCMNRQLVTNLLELRSLKKFTLVRDYFSEIKIREMVNFCDGTRGLSYYCPEIQCYDPSGRWLELLIITVNIDRDSFALDAPLRQRFPGVLLHQ